MSVDIDWETLTSGPDGLALAETIRAFVHERFQHIALPKLIRSVKCHAFEFGSIAPQIVLKDICDPLPDFYENDEDDETPDEQTSPPHAEKVTESLSTRRGDSQAFNQLYSHPIMNTLGRTNDPSLSRGGTPGILGGTSNLGYFHLPLSVGLSGTATPLAAVAGARFQTGPGSTVGNTYAPPNQQQHHHSDSFSSISPPSSPASRPTSRETSHSYFRHPTTPSDNGDARTPDPPIERSPSDLQIVFHATYAGDIHLSLTAEVFLDYPMPSFVGIPLKLNITGMTFNGVGILAYIKKRAHLCFLAPEDAEALVGGDGVLGSPGEEEGGSVKVGGLLEEIKIESQMGETDDGKQVLKNVGKIEKFILEQVQRIFEEEFVYPSFWTFLV